MRARIAAAAKGRGKLPRYIFRLDRYWRLDGETGGSGAERFNHSCSPNLAAPKMGGRILFFSRRPIRSGEELTLGYRYHPKSPALLCRCGSANCRGTINLTPGQWRKATARSSRRPANPVNC